MTKSVTQTSKGINHRMSSIRSKNTKVELKLRRSLWSKGYRYRIHANLPGKPDLIFPGKKIALFVDGDFWHGYDWKNLKKKLKNGFWINKIKTNIKRDIKVTKQLNKDGWVVLRFWEHEINSSLQVVIEKIISAINSRRRHPFGFDTKRTRNN